jgi:hypothetical protein
LKKKEPDFIRKEIRLTSRNRGNEESFNYEAKFPYAAKNLAKGMRGEKEAGSATISFSVNIIERNVGRT